ncbi:tRNA 4-thiouridine(8) synthase ThiI [Marinobacter halodurans]|uniref:tRNA sulfurtransferase n=1 Tax=Marinobacter halodurans TaxID=2528979 RepID=A0ABY1ZG63_9GAMM|nr:tRNA uracil 4-sulfurtransferase ThiI [Marinobacter halodurans]TBW47980.1 tRNA 4-thiouridine(8) synthase ThiI [Marinobacter halodurans]
MNFLIRPSAEVAIKSKPVRRQQIRQLRQNVSKILRRVDDRIRVEGSWDRVDVLVPDELDSNELVERLRCIPGISNFLEVRDYPLTTLDDVADRALAVWGDALAGKTFAVRGRRTGEHDFSSADLERLVGSVLLAQSGASGVRLKDPDEQVRIEVIHDRYHIVERRFEGLGGYPLGSVETAVSLISGGYDSSVSTYLTMRRGLRTHFLFFNLGGAAHEVGVKQVAHYLWSRYGSSHSVKFISVPFEDVVGEIMRSVDHRHMGVVLKRMMLKAAAAVAQTGLAKAIVTGDAVAQVSSQTLANLNVVDRASDEVVLRPLITMDKVDIIRIAEQIGTESYARNMPEYCGVISSKPVTRAKQHRVEAEEAKMDPAVLERAIESRVETPIQRVLESMSTPEDVELVQTPAVDDVIIDVRHPNEEERAPLHLTNNQVLHIPFYELNQRVDELTDDCRYLLYCDKGTMSRMHAGHLKASGLDNVLVYAPA